MKKLLLAATVLGAAGMYSPAFAADAAPAPEESQVGFVGDIWGGYYFLGGSSGDADDSDNKGDFPSAGTDASLIFGASDAFLLQLTGQGALNFVGKADDDQMELGWQIAAHAMHGSGIGVFGGYGGVDYDGNDSSNLWFAGAEYLHDFGSGDFLLQAGYLDSNLGSGTDTIADAWFVRAAPSFNVSDSLGMGLHVGYADGDVDDPGENGYLVSWGASLDYALESAPVTLFAAYDGFYVHSQDASADEHQIKAGIRISLGGLADQVIDTPEIFRWVGVSQRTD
ncbi:MAG: hypothetical protein IT541_13460 [Hyphomicrobiales bacterium]|nr:hypothetical protein [Hyphomicrobiales bacterium]